MEYHETTTTIGWMSKSFPPLTPGTLFAGRYQIIEELGEGGMGRVYKALDKELQETISLKLIHPDIASDSQAVECFQSEIKLARKVSHKHVCRLYHLGKAENTFFITMEYVPGRDLRSILKMTGPLSAGKALNIAKQLCEGLSEAHDAGIVHRDLKSNNIMLDKEGNVRIMDFGLAHCVEEFDVTAPNVMAGTPEYLSPEQIEGKEIDRRSDIYSLGIILYEMVTGAVPFNGDSPLKIAIRHKNEAPKDPRILNALVPAGLSRLILKCLAKDRNKRFQNTAELYEELTHLHEDLTTTQMQKPAAKPFTSILNRWKIQKSWIAVIIVIGLAVVAKMAFFDFGGPVTAVAASEKKMLVVLPFKNLGSYEDEYFADGITQAITTRLAALQGLGVISRISALEYKESNMTPRQIGMELGADYVLEGTVRRDRDPDNLDHVWVTTNLFQVKDSIHIWSNQYDSVLADIFSVQSLISEQVAQQLDLSILEPERNAMDAQLTTNLEAYDYYLHGNNLEAQAALNGDFQVYKSAIEMYEKATETDPNFIHAYLRLASIHSFMYLVGNDNTEQRRIKAKAAVDKALELDPDMPEAHLMLAFYHYRCHMDFEKALEEFEIAQKARPNIDRTLLGYIWRRQGRWEESLSILEEIFRLDPRSSGQAYQIGLSYFVLRKYDKAIEWFDRALSINPDRYLAKIAKVETFWYAAGDIQASRDILELLQQRSETDYLWYKSFFLERRFQEALDVLGTIPFNSLGEDPLIFQKNLEHASVYFAMGDFGMAQIHAEAARIALEENLDEHEDDARYMAGLGLTYAYLGLPEDALRYGLRATLLHPLSVDSYLSSYYLYNLALIYTVLGEYDQAISLLEELLSLPVGHVISVPMLRIDPTWDPLRSHPDFKKLLQN